MIPKKFEHSDLSDFPECTTEPVKNFLKQDVNLNVLNIHGDTFSGKTRMCYAILRHLTEEKSVHMCDAYAESLQFSRSKGASSEFKNYFYSVPFLIIDGLDFFHPTNSTFVKYWFCELFTDIMITRNHFELKTIISTCFPIKKLIEDWREDFFLKPLSFALNVSHMGVCMHPRGLF